MTYWIVAGLLCNAALGADGACVWQVPVTSHAFREEDACLNLIARGDDVQMQNFRDGLPPYAALRCKVSHEPRRME